MRIEESTPSRRQEVVLGEKRLQIVVENPRGSYKSFDTDRDPIWADYPLKGVTYPVDYGYIEGYASEDGHDLDVFIGTGNLFGYIKMWRMDVPIETKTFMNLTADELESVIAIFRPVIAEKKIFENQEDFIGFLSGFEKESVEA